MKDWAEECAERWMLKHVDGVYSAQDAIKEAIREALEKAASLVVAGDAERIREAIRALGAK